MHDTLSENTNKFPGYITNWLIAVMCAHGCDEAWLGLMLQIDEDLTARFNMADYKFTFHEKGKEHNPAWMAPEG